MSTLTTGRTSSGLFTLAPWKLVVMSVLSLGLYEVYWGYRHWKGVKAALAEPMWAWARAVFIPFSFRFLARDTEEVLLKYGQPTPIRVALLGNTYFLLAAVSNLVGFFSTIAFAVLTPLRVLPLVYFQRVVNGATSSVNPDSVVRGRFTVGEWLACAVCVILLALAVGGELLAPSE